jgi:WhiB family redox-sensing transcriptional regulator
MAVRRIRNVNFHDCKSVERKKGTAMTEVNYRVNLSELLMYEAAPWMDDAICRDLATDVFFADSDAPKKSTVAKAICSACPVREDCLDYAIRNCELYGIWGGTTATERRFLRQEWLRKNVPTS